MELVQFEILPPPETWSRHKLSKWCAQVAHLLHEHEVHAVNLPEVINESREGERGIEFVPKIDNARFAKLLNNRVGGLQPTLYKVCVRIEKNKFEEWMQSIYSQGVRHLVLVGGERQEEKKKGYSVIDAARYIKKRYPDMHLGGIAIFTRSGEAKRIHEKMEAGIDFFVSQIIFEVTNMKLALLNLNKLCQLNHLKMPAIYISLALASKIKDIEFMKWLGVEFPTAVFSYLTKECEQEMENCSLEVVEMLLDEIFHFREKEKIPLGFNVEHVMYSNLHLSKRLYLNIQERLKA